MPEQIKPIQPQSFPSAKPTDPMTATATPDENPVDVNEDVESADPVDAEENEDADPVGDGVAANAASATGDRGTSPRADAWDGRETGGVAHGNRPAGSKIDVEAQNPARNTGRAEPGINAPARDTTQSNQPRK